MTTRPTRLTLIGVVISSALMLVGPASPVQAQIPGLPDLGSGNLIGLAQGLTGSIFGQMLGPAVRVDFGGDATVNSDGERISISGTYRCAGLFLPVQGLDGPRVLEVIVTQGFPKDDNVAKGYRKFTTPICDDVTHNFPGRAIPIDYGQPLFGRGTAIVEVIFTATDITGTTRVSATGDVNVTRE